MPRVGDVFQLLSGTLAVPNTAIQSAPYNAQQNDWVLEANTPRPISAGGTGSTTASGARTSLGTMGAGDLAASPTKSAVVNTDSVVIIDSAAANVTKRWLVSDLRTAMATMTDINPHFVSTDAGAGAGPILYLERLSASPADDDLGGQIQFRGKTSEATTVVYADILLTMDDVSVNTVGGVTTSTTDGSLIFRTQRAGTLTTALTLGPTTATVNSPLTVGAITSSGAITSGAITSSGTVTSSGIFDSSTPNVILSANNGKVYLRPNLGSTTAEFRVENTGDAFCARDMNADHFKSGSFYSPSSTVELAATGASGGVYLRPRGPSVTTGQAILNSVGDFQIAGDTAYKVGGGSWTATSDERIKDVLGNYESGLEAILALEPVRYRYKDDEQKVEFIGLVAQQAERSMPELVEKVHGVVDGVEVDDLRMLDPSPLLFALVNAVRELTARVAELEANAV